MYRLWVQHNREREPQSHDIAELDIIVGSDRVRCAIVLYGREVAFRHARLMLVRDRLMVIDLDSEAGTFVAGERITGPVMVDDREPIEIAGYRLWMERLPQRPRSGPHGEPGQGQEYRPESLAPDEETTLESLPDTERYLLEMVHQQPGRDEPRLVYADWLLENDDPRGELIALQCAGPAQALDTAARLQEISDAHGYRWLEPIYGARAPDLVAEETAVVAVSRADDCFPFYLDRGFLAHPLCVTSDQLAQSADALHRLSPTVYEIFHEVVWLGQETVVHAAQSRGPAGSITPVAIKRSHQAGPLDRPPPGWSHDRGFGAQIIRNELAMARAAAHPNVAHYMGLAYWGADGDPALVMEWIDGWSLREIIETPGAIPLAPPVAVAIVRELLVAVSHLHTGLGGPERYEPLCHGEIRPDHVMIDRSGVVKLIDFSWAESETVKLPFPSAGWNRALIVTGVDPQPWRVSYLSPDALDAAPASPRDDVYSVGVILYELLCGQNPFRDPDASGHDVLDAVTLGEYALPGQLRPMPLELEAIIRQGLDLQPERRYGTGKAMLEALSKVIEQEGWATGPTFIASQLRSRLG